MGKIVNKYQIEVNFRVGASINVLAESKKDAIEKLHEAIDNGKFSIVEYGNDTIGLDVEYDYNFETSDASQEFEVEDIHEYDSEYDLKFEEKELYVDEIDRDIEIIDEEEEECDI